MRYPASSRSYLFVGVQILCLGLILVTGPLIASKGVSLFLELFGVALGVWALTTMKIRNLHILPDVRVDSQLITHGPYRYIRHPMYSAVLLVTLGLVLDDFSGMRLFVWFILVCDLLAKLSYEEQLLSERFQGYQEYQQHTARLFPFVF